MLSPITKSKDVQCRVNDQLIDQPTPLSINIGPTHLPALCSGPAIINKIAYVVVIYNNLKMNIIP